MARPWRIERIGAWYHVSGRGNERRAIFREDRDREHFCQWLAEMVERFDIRLHALVLMDNHDHLILELTGLNLSRAGQWLNGSYSTWFNRRHRRCGHLFQEYREYVEAAGREGLEESPWESRKEQVVLGGEAFLESLRQRVKGDAREQRGAKRLAASRGDLAEIMARVEKVKGEKWEAFRDRYGDSGRDLVLYLGRRECGRTLNELAKAVGLEGYKAAASAIQRYEKRWRSNKTERALLERAEAVEE
jgi:REP element-mobilizing transposase RayT